MADGAEQVVGGRNAVGAIDDRAVLADDEDGAVDVVGIDSRLTGYRFQGAVCARQLQAIIDQQIEGQLQMDLEALVAVEIVRVDAERNGIETSIRVDCPANRGQLVRSAAGEIFRIEDQQDSVGAEIVREGDRGSAGALEREVNRSIPYLWSQHGLFGHGGILYARAFHCNRQKKPLSAREEGPG